MLAEVLKVESVLKTREPAREIARGSVRLLVVIESPRGLLNAPAIAASSPRVVGLMFAAEDYGREMGLPTKREGEAQKMLYARSAMAVWRLRPTCRRLTTSDRFKRFGWPRRLRAAVAVAGRLAQLAPCHRRHVFRCAGGREKPAARRKRRRIFSFTIKVSGGHKMLFETRTGRIVELVIFSKEEIKCRKRASSMFSPWTRRDDSSSLTIFLSSIRGAV